MSVMRCTSCEQAVDTDSHEMHHHEAQDLCDWCEEERLERGEVEYLLWSFERDAQALAKHLKGDKQTEGAILDLRQKIADIENNLEG